MEGCQDGRGGGGRLGVLLRPSWWRPWFPPCLLYAIEVCLCIVYCLGEDEDREEHHLLMVSVHEAVEEDLQAVADVLFVGT